MLDACTPRSPILGPVFLVYERYDQRDQSGVFNPGSRLQTAALSTVSRKFKNYQYSSPDPRDRLIRRAIPDCNANLKSCSAEGITVYELWPENGRYRAHYLLRYGSPAEITGAVAPKP